MKTFRKIVSAMTASALLMLSITGCSGSGKDNLLDPQNPTTVTIWNYYNGDQLSAFESLVNQFNETIGTEKGIVVVSVSQGNIGTLATALLDAVDGKVGADDVPSAAAIYPETVYILNNEDAVVPLDPYFTADELAEYVPSFIEEGRLRDNGSLLMLPVSKSTEAFVVNSTDWTPFEAATGISASSITSFEALTAAAEAYYNWTDGLTPDVAEDGKALYGRDSVANYIFVGAKQLGHEMFKVGSDGNVSVDIDKTTFRTLWDNYYIPFINGYFGSYASYRSEDIKTGLIISMTGSTSGISYIPTAVTDADDNSYDIDITVSKPLNFENAADKVAVLQGAGYSVLKTNDAEEYAAAEFLKWFTDTEQNLTFSITSGYSPVKTAAKNAEKIQAALTVDSQKSQNMLNALLISSEIYTNGNTFSTRAFGGSKEVRDVLNDALQNIAAADRQAVSEKIASGASRADAVAPYITDEYFDAWYNNLVQQVNSTIDAGKSQAADSAAQ